MLVSKTGVRNLREGVKTFIKFYKNYYGKLNFPIVKLIVKGHLAGGVCGGSKKHPEAQQLFVS